MGGLARVNGRIPTIRVRLLGSGFSSLRRKQRSVSPAEIIFQNTCPAIADDDFGLNPRPKLAYEDLGPKPRPICILVRGLGHTVIPGPNKLSSASGFRSWLWVSQCGSSKLGFIYSRVNGAIIPGYFPGRVVNLCEGHWDTRLNCGMGRKPRGLVLVLAGWASAGKGADPRCGTKSRG